jgi:hypothetical protein
MQFNKGLPLFAVSLLLLSASAAAVAAPFPACNLMTQQTAAGIFGGPVGAGRVEMGTAAVSDCRFDAENGGFAEIGVMDLKAFGMPTAEMFKMMATQPNPGHQVEQIAGLGESAFIVLGPDDATLNILIHDKALIVSTSKGKSAGIKAALIATARQAIGKV